MTLEEARALGIHVSPGFIMEETFYLDDDKDQLAGYLGLTREDLG